MRIYWKVLLLSLAFSGIVQISQGQSNEPTAFTAADLTYRCVGDYRYDVELSIYTECGSPRGDMTTINQLQLPFSSEETGEEGDFLVQKTGSSNGMEVNIFCDEEPSNCEGGDNRGLTRYTYRGTLDLRSYEPATDWNIRWVANLRSYFLESTIESPEVESYYVEATINTEDFPCNNSVQYNTGTRGPIVSACTGEEETYNMLAVDPDGDEVTYEFAPPRSTVNADMVYQQGYSEERPVTVSSPITISDQGIITMNATTPGEIGITDVIVREYKDGELASTLRRGVQISTFTCDNQPPEHIGFKKDSSFSARVCVGTDLSRGDLELAGNDPDGDEVRFNLLQAVRQSDNYQLSNNILRSFSAVDGRGDIVFTPEQADTGVYELEVELIDNGCPTNQVTTETYTLEIIPEPDFSLGDDTFFQCEDFELDPEAIIGAEPATYYWVRWDSVPDPDNPEEMLYTGDTISNDPVLDITEPGRVSLHIVDDAGCRSSDQRNFNYSLVNGFEWEDYCLGLETQFTSEATSLDGEIIRREWYFSDAGTDYELSGEEVSHEFSEEGTYEVYHVIENEPGCVDTLMKEISICTAGFASIFQPRTACTHDNGIERDMDFFDNGFLSDECAVTEERRWTTYDENGNQVGAPFISEEDSINGVSKYTENPGDYTIALVAQYESGCKDSVTHDYVVHPRPIYNLNTDSILYLNCDQPDTTVTATIDDESQGTPPILYDGEVAGDTIELTLSEVGRDSMRVVDDVGCEYYVNVEMKFPLDVSFAYDPVCTPEEEMNFYASVENEFTLESLEWDFGDGNTASGSEVSHLYEDPDDYNVTVSASDTVGCNVSETLTVYNTFPVERFEMTPDVLQQSICVDDEVTFFTAYENETTGSHIDTIYWDFGDGTTQIYSDTSSSGSVDEGEEVTYSFTATEPVSISNRVVYNSHPGVHDQYCEIINDGELDIEIKPEFDGDILDNRTCIGDTAIFIFDRTVNPEVELVSANWQIAPFSDLDNIVAETDTLYPKPFISEQDYIPNNGYRITAYLEDANGCLHTEQASFVVGQTLPGRIVYEEPCPDEEIDVSLRAPLEQYTGFYFVDQESRDTLAIDIYEPRNNETGMFDIITTSYENQGEHDVSLYMITPGNGTFLGETKECRGVLDTTIRVKPVPIVDFEADTVCAWDEAVTFTNLTDTNNTVITEYLWEFGDDSTSSDVNPTHVFRNEGGYQQVTLHAYTEEGCDESVTKEVYVKYKPEADYYLNNEYIEANIPLLFIDDSRSGSDLVYTFYDFGDGNTSEEFDPVHTYDSIRIYDVTHIVENVEGCSDTIVNPTDLNTYLEIPNTFSPNNDGLNDDVGLLHKSVYELYEFKIYNRWGEVVFDANGDLDRRWDGTFRGKDQEVGVYVVHVKALGAYGTEYNFKKNLRLIR